MRAFYLAWTEEIRNLSQPVTDAEIEELSRLVTELPWGQNLVLLHKIADPPIRAWYARKTLEHGWSRAVLTSQIESRLHERAGKALTNFAVALPSQQSDMAQQALKDPYVFDFLALNEEARERELEQGLLDHV